MKYNSRDEFHNEGQFKDLIYVECWQSHDGAGIYFETGSRKRANRRHKESKRVVGKTAVVVVYPLDHAPDFYLTMNIAKQVAVAHMTGVGKQTVSLRD